jgi:hypothetical protein
MASALIGGRSVLPEDFPLWFMRTVIEIPGYAGADCAAPVKHTLRLAEHDR